MKLASNSETNVESPDAQAYWDVPVYADHTCVEANRVDARFVDHKGKKVWAVEISCRGWRILERRMRRRQSRTGLCDGSWGSNTQDITSTSAILSLMCYVGGWSKELELTMKMLVGVRAKGVLFFLSRSFLLLLLPFFLFLLFESQYWTP